MRSLQTYIFRCVFFLMGLFYASTTLAEQSLQDKAFEGIVLYEVVYTGEDSLQTLHHLTPFVSLFIKGDQYIIDFQYNNITIFQSRAAESSLASIQTKGSTEELFCIHLDSETPDKNNYTYEDEEQTMLGYKVKKAILQDNTLEPQSNWVCSELPYFVNEYLCPGLIGLPLEFALPIQDTFIQLRAFAIKEISLDDSLFEAPTDCFFIQEEEFQDLFEEFY